MGNDHASWYNLMKRKVIVLSYEEFYMKKMYNCISLKPFPKQFAKEYVQENAVYADYELLFWFMEGSNRHLWRHQYQGTQGIILMFSFTEESEPNIIIEVMNMFIDDNLANIPALIIFDTSHKKKSLEDDLLKELKKHQEITYNIINVDFSRNIIDIKKGIDWLCKSMKSI